MDVVAGRSCIVHAPLCTSFILILLIDFIAPHMFMKAAIMDNKK